MRTIIHLSDLHFGTERCELIAPLVEFCQNLNPNIVIVSGDLTQRARKEQFAAAYAFFQQLPQPQIIVPGNHDIPFYNLFARFFLPLNNYRRYITRDLLPTYQDSEIKVVGINTARSLTFKNGRINEEQIKWLSDQFSGVPEDVLKVVVTHHPFDLPSQLKGQEELVGRAEQALPILQACGADLFLAGHLHQSASGFAIVPHQEAGRQTLLVQAGTALSNRHRGEPNSFNVINVNGSFIKIQEYVWVENERQFCCQEEETFKRISTGWGHVTAAA